MDLSSDVQDLHQQFKFIKARNETLSPKPASSKSVCDFDIIDVNKINFGNDETWLYKVPNGTENPVIDLNNWLHKDLGNIKDDDFFLNSAKSQNDYQKNIEKYNEEVYGNSDTQNERKPSLNNMKKSNDSGILSGSSIIQEVSESIATSAKPLNFDLSQPTNSYYFENILANSADIDSFQNMSPPSLVNSMCSSTFANLMESSFIKNDPVLREIRDTDYTETVLLQDSEPPMFQSITESLAESCSSINSDSPEKFDKSTPVSKLNNSDFDMNTTYEKPKGNESQMDYVQNNSNAEIPANKQLFPNFNGTYRRTPKSSGMFRKSDVKEATINLNSTFDVSPKEHILDQNTTQTLIKDCSIKSFEGKKYFPNSLQITDLNRLSYCLDEENVRLDSTYNEDNNDLNRTVNMQRSSLGCPTGSADSLDRMSSLSNSSRESNKMLNMADVDAIVEMQERNIIQKYLLKVTGAVYSKLCQHQNPTQDQKKLWENNFISPIISNEHLSDSDLSSNDEYKSVKSSFSLENYNSKPTKSLGYLGTNIDTKVKTNPRSTFTLASQKPLQVISSNIRASYSNLRTVQSNIPGSQSNLYKPSTVNRPPSSATNLKTMGQKLKGSYTSLRPISANLPVAPPITSQLNITATLPRATNPNVTQNIDVHSKVVEVSSII
ncbi:hypothetical protein NQ314_006903 [Rhamnusium bicolor]|uniref:Uncharacterized protein n=1 Tax=Rhamnusium bicolor TaxID=1586634 RepID=A0AAV8YWB5_9CUCU|nr:hypothetical protein NQ314_006903 [Rhamnusium bicolor]